MWPPGSCLEDLLNKMNELREVIKDKVTYGTDGTGKIDLCIPLGEPLEVTEQRMKIRCRQLAQLKTLRDKAIFFGKQAGDFGAVNRMTKEWLPKEEVTIRPAAEALG